jgi:hypothetical protein
MKASEDSITPSREPEAVPPAGIVTRGARKAVDDFLRLVTSGDYLENLPWIGAAIRKQGEDVLPALTEALDHDSPRAAVLSACTILTIAAKTPYLLGDQRAIEKAMRIVTDSLQQGSVESRLWPCLLINYGSAPHAVLRFLQPLLQDSDHRLQICAAAAMSTIDAGNSDLIRILRRGARDSHPILALTATHALARLGLHSAEPIRELISALLDSEVSCKHCALMALTELGTAARIAVDPLRSFITDERQDASIRGAAATTLGSITSGSDQVIPFLFKILDSAEDEIIQGAIDGIVRIGVFTKEVALRIAALLSSDHEETRIAAALGLSAMGSAAAPALPVLLGRVQHERSDRMAAALADAIGAIGAAAVPFIIPLLREHDFSQLPILDAALSRMDSSAAAAFAQSLGGETDEWVLGAFVALIRCMGHKSAPVVPYLAARLDPNDEELSAYLLAALQCTGPAAAPAIGAILLCVMKGSDELAAWGEQVLKNVSHEATPVIEAALATATGDTEKQRLKHALNGMQSKNDNGSQPFDDIKESLLRLAMHAIEILIEEGPQSSRSLASILRAREREGAMPQHLDISARHILDSIYTVENNLNLKLTTRTPGRKGVLTPQGRSLLPKLKEYLRMKDERRNQRR